MKSTNRAFTLIELLIVVAIIAILAAIAVPNFLEAQTRSKVSRVKADMRSMETAMEAYRVDYNRYVPDNFPGQRTDVESYNRLTTPVAYITSVPISAFNEVNVEAGKKYFEYWLGGIDQSTGQYILDPGGEETGILYRMTSVGPDGDDDYMQYYYSGEFSNMPIDIKNNTPRYVNGLYDPTNGAKSSGDLMVSNMGIHNR